MKLLPIALPGLLVTGLLVAACIPSVDEETPETPDGSTDGDGSGGHGSGGFTSSSGGASTASGGVTSSGGAVGSGGFTSSSGGVSGSGGLALGSGGTTGGAGRSGGGNSFPVGGRSGLGGRSGAGGRVGTGGSAAPSGQGGRGGRGGTAGASGTTTGTFAQVAQILGTSCGVTNCHSDMTHSDLRNDAGLYARLVNAAPAGSAAMAACKTMKLVTPNSPSTSVLSQIVKAAVTGCSTARMPDMCSTGGLPRACLTAAQISTIDGWIMAGARM